MDAVGGWWSRTQTRSAGTQNQSPCTTAKLGWLATQKHPVIHTGIQLFLLVSHQSHRTQRDPGSENCPPAGSVSGCAGTVHCYHCPTATTVLWPPLSTATAVPRLPPSRSSTPSLCCHTFPGSAGSGRTESPYFSEHRTLDMPLILLC